MFLLLHCFSALILLLDQKDIHSLKHVPLINKDSLLEQMQEITEENWLTQFHRQADVKVKVLLTTNKVLMQT